MLVHIIIGWQATLLILRFGTDVPESAGLVQTSTPYLPKDWEQGVDGLQNMGRRHVTRRHVMTM